MKRKWKVSLLAVSLVIGTAYFGLNTRSGFTGASAACSSINDCITQYDHDYYEGTYYCCLVFSVNTGHMEGLRKPGDGQG